MESVAAGIGARRNGVDVTLLKWGRVDGTTGDGPAPYWLRPEQKMMWLIDLDKLTEIESQFVVSMQEMAGSTQSSVEMRH